MSNRSKFSAWKQNFLCLAELHGRFEVFTGGVEVLAADENQFIAQPSRGIFQGLEHSLAGYRSVLRYNKVSPVADAEKRQTRSQPNSRICYDDYRISQHAYKWFEVIGFLVLRALPNEKNVIRPMLEQYREKLTIDRLRT